MISQELLERFRVGDPISDNELTRLIKYYDQTLTNIELLGPEFNLFIKEIRLRTERLHGYKEARHMPERPANYK